VLVIDADFSSLRGVRAVAVDLDRVSAGAQHYYALAVIGLASILILWRVVVRASPLAMCGLAAVGLITLVVMAAVDVPTLGTTPPQAQLYASTSTWTGDAVTLEATGGSLLIVSGLGQLALLGGGSRVPRRRRPAAATQRA
jgi:hypothetical protein